MVRFEPRPPWTRAHEALVHAWETLHQVHARRGLVLNSLHDWLERNYGEAKVRRLTTAQARNARRRLNAWRGGIEGRCLLREYPRQWRRNYRRARASWQRTASNTATNGPPIFSDIIRGTALEGLGRLLSTESNSGNQP
jgi:hypothetical protein